MLAQRKEKRRVWMINNEVRPMQIACEIETFRRNVVGCLKIYGKPGARANYNVSLNKVHVLAVCPVHG